MKPDSLPIFKTAQTAAPALKGLPLLRLGFRPFYIGGALLAALNVPLWVAIFLGWLQLTPASQPLLWHAHEMLFGFTVAIIVGFLMTAGKTWTGDQAFPAHRHGSRCPRPVGDPIRRRVSARDGDNGPAELRGDRFLEDIVYTSR